MDWKFCWIVSMIFVILFRISQLESKLENEDLEETKCNTYEMPEEIINMNFDGISVRTLVTLVMS